MTTLHWLLAESQLKPTPGTTHSQDIINHFAPHFSSTDTGLRSKRYCSVDCDSLRPTWCLERKTLCLMLVSQSSSVGIDINWISAAALSFEQNQAKTKTITVILDMEKWKNPGNCLLGVLDKIRQNRACADDIRLSVGYQYQRLSRDSVQVFFKTIGFRASVIFNENRCIKTHHLPVFFSGVWLTVHRNSVWIRKTN